MSEILKLLNAINKDIKILFKILRISNVLNQTCISSRSFKGFKSQIFTAFPSGSWWKLDNIQSEHFFFTYFKLIEKIETDLTFKKTHLQQLYKNDLIWFSRY